MQVVQYILVSHVSQCTAIILLVIQLVISQFLLSPDKFLLSPDKFLLLDLCLAHSSRV